MDYINIIKRAARITWRYKVLWILGILLALSSGGGSGNPLTYTFNGSNGDMAPPGFDGLAMPEPGLILGLLALACCVGLVLAVVLVIVQYVARTGLYRAVDAIEETGAAPTWRDGFRLGWNYRALRMFLLDLIVGIAAFLAALLLILLAATPLLLLIFDSEALRVIGIIATIGLEIFVLLLIVIAVIIVGVLQQFWRREIALADRSVGEAFAMGTQLVRGKAGDVAILWLLMAAIGIGVGLLFIPIVLGLGIVGLAVGGGLGYALYTLTDSAAWAMLFGLPLFLLIVAIPILIIQGIYLVFDANVWTLAYRDASAVARQSGSELSITA
jgi:hypothetical protein